MYKCRYVKEQHIHLLSWHTNRDGVCYISSIFLYFYWDFDNRDCFHDKRTFIGSFIGSNPSARVCLEVLVTILSLNLETVYIGSFLCYISFCFLYSPVFFSHKVTQLPLACHQPLLTWKVDNLNKCILFEFLLQGFTQNTKYINLDEQGYFNYLYLSIIFFAFPYVVLHRMVSVSILTASRHIFSLTFFTFSVPLWDSQSLF